MNGSLFIYADDKGNEREAIGRLMDTLPTFSAKGGGVIQ